VGASAYQTQLSIDPTFTTQTITLTSAAAAVTTALLAADTLYYWRVCALDGVGTAGNWSAVWSFTTLTQISLAAPQLVSPANAAADIAVPVSLTWSSVVGATQYQVQLSTDAACATATTSTCTTTSLQVSTLPSGTLYYWRVCALDASGDVSVWSPIWSFSCSVYGSKTNGVDGAALVWVPGGSFTMGSPYNTWGNAPYTQQVTLNGYWLDKYDVTVAQYCAFCAATGRALPSFPTGYSWTGKTGWHDPALQQHPIVNVSWFDAQAYAIWAGMALPTEAQWEFAACGPASLNYPWGGTATATDITNGWDQTRCSNWFNSYVKNITTWPVGSFPTGVSWCGALDMAGNVWQWCADWYGNYSTTPVTNPTGPANGSYRMQRGGCWYGNSAICRSADRSDGIPGMYWNYVGFRCASPSTITPVTLATPVLSTPTNAATGVAVPVTLKWGAVTGATCYQVQWSTDSTFSTATTSNTTSAPTCTLATPAAGTCYFWRVCALDAAGDVSAYSTVWSFTTATLPVQLSAPILLSPANGVIAVSTPVALCWNAVSGASSYQVQLSTDSTFVTLTTTLSATTTSATTAALPIGTA